MSRSVARTLARFNRHVTNRLTTRPAEHLPGFGVVGHVGRRSGRRYRTPVNVYERADGFVIALPYGREAEWVRNVVAAGGCELTTRGRTYRLTSPEVFHDQSRGAAAPLARPMLRLAGAADFIRLRRE